MYFLCSFLLALGALYLLLNTRMRHLALDRPNERSLHVNLTPRTGGLAIMVGVLLTWLIMGVDRLWLMLPAALVGVSLMDDILGLKARWRFLSHVAVCSAFLWTLAGQLPLWSLPLLLLAMVWMVNLYNFMDGADGLAGGMAFFGFGAYGVAAYLGGSPEIVMLTAAVVGANLAFLIFNFHPAKIFMGDAGSVPQGFLAAALGLWGWLQGAWPAWFPFLVFSPFIVDATVTLMQRIWRREKIWQAHKTHYYQRLVQMGWGHRKTALAAYLLMLATGASGLGLLGRNEGMVAALLVGWLLIYAWLFRAIDRRWGTRGNAGSDF